MDGDVRLRPVAEGDLEVVTRCLTDPESLGASRWHGWTDAARWRRRWADDGLLGDDDGHLLVVLGHERLGLASWTRHRTSPAASCWTVSLALLPQARGHGYGARAFRHLVAYLFAHGPVERVEALSDTEDVGEHRALEEAGFAREGVLRRYTFRAGAWRDTAVYSVLREEAAGG